MSILSERLSRAEDRMEDMALKEVPAQLASFVLQLVEDEVVVTGVAASLLLSSREL